MLLNRLLSSPRSFSSTVLARPDRSISAIDLPLKSTSFTRSLNFEVLCCLENVVYGILIFAKSRHCFNNEFTATYAVFVRVCSTYWMILRGRCKDIDSWWYAPTQFISNESHVPRVVLRMSRIIAGAQLPREQLNDIPRRMGGIYLLYEKRGQSKVCFYVGRSDNLRKRLKNHRFHFDYFSYVRLSKKSREFMEPFLIAAIDAFPDEKMKVKLHNLQYMAIKPQIFRGRKDLYWIEKIEE